MAQKIQWYPGHMHKAMREIKETLSQVQVLIEVLDARLPYSSENPAIEQLRAKRPVLKLLNKADLADAEMTQVWLKHFMQHSDVQALAVNAKDKHLKNAIIAKVKALYEQNGGTHYPCTCMVIGIPNAGKSTLINNLTGRQIAKTGDEAAVTRQQQKIRLHEDIIMLDTPGVLWPNIENRHSGFRLAITGAVRQTALNFVDVADYAAGALLHLYPQRLQERYNIETLPTQSGLLLEEIGRRRGCLMKGAVVDIERAAKILINDIRAGELGLLTLETPTMAKQELLEVEQERLEKLEKKRLRKARRK